MGLGPDLLILHCTLTVLWKFLGTDSRIRERHTKLISVEGLSQILTLAESATILTQGLAFSAFILLCLSVILQNVQGVI